MATNHPRPTGARFVMEDVTGTPGALPLLGWPNLPSRSKEVPGPPYWPDGVRHRARRSAAVMHALTRVSRVRVREYLSGRGRKRGKASSNARRIVLHQCRNCDTPSGSRCRRTSRRRPNLRGMGVLDALDRVLTVANGKGGVGKSTVAANVAGLSAAAGWRVLLVDFDPQGNAGHLLGYGWDGRSDAGRHLVDALVSGRSLAPPLLGVRPGLDVIPGGEQLDTLEDVLAGRVKRGQDIQESFAAALAPIAGEYDLIVIDTPPTRPVLLRMALGATRWIVVPTRPGRMSIEGLRALAGEMVAARRTNPDLELLGAVLYDVESSASVIRRNAIEDITAALGGAAPVFTTVIRHALAPVCESEERGLLIHEIAERVDNAEPFWVALKEGRTPTRVPGSAPALAEDLVLLTQEILQGVDARERHDVAEMVPV